MEREIDYGAVYRALPAPIALLWPDLTFADVNRSYLRIARRAREDLLGRYLFDEFPENPTESAPAAVRNVRASLERVLSTGQGDIITAQRYDLENPDLPGVFEQRYWSVVNTPVVGPGGDVRMIVHRVEELTEFVRTHGALPTNDAERMMGAELYARARELQAANERLRLAHGREQQVAQTLQEAMLPAQPPLGRLRAAVRYLPAGGSLNVCGDWYDLVELPGQRVAVAVGDVVGHGLDAACVMGQLRSALSAAIRVADGPAQALDVLSRYARSVRGAESTSAMQAIIDWPARTIAYSNAGHPPAALLRADGVVEFLDQATDPPLAARPDPVARPQASLPFSCGGALVLYTDGLIERRGEDIDVGLARIAGSLIRRRGAGPDELADALLADLLVEGGQADDIVLVVMLL